MREDVNQVRLGFWPKRAPCASSFASHYPDGAYERRAAQRTSSSALELPGVFTPDRPLT